VFFKEVVMTNPRITDDAIRDLIIQTIEPGEGTIWKRFEERFGTINLLPRIERILENLQKSGYICIKGRRYRLAKKGLERYEVLNPRVKRSIHY
jgi:hypothetical protein